jgi:hypothetical protein
MRPANPIYAKPMKYCSSFSASEKAILLIYIFYRDTSRFRANLTFFMSPMILNTSAPFAISGFSTQIKDFNGLFMTQTKPQLLTPRSYPAVD